MARRASTPVKTGEDLQAARGEFNPWPRRVLIFAACVLTLNGLVGERGLAENLRARAQVRTITRELQRLRQENVRLAEFADRLRRDPRTIEDIARRELGLMRKGEILVVLKDAPAR